MSWHKSHLSPPWCDNVHDVVGPLGPNSDSYGRPTCITGVDRYVELDTPLRAVVPVPYHLVRATLT